MDKEQLKTHIATLKQRHYHLEMEINRLIHTKAANEDIAKLKKVKLQLKENIVALEEKLTT